MHLESHVSPRDRYISPGDSSANSIISPNAISYRAMLIFAGAALIFGALLGLLIFLICHRRDTHRGHRVRSTFLQSALPQITTNKGDAKKTGDNGSLYFDATDGKPIYIDW